VVGKIKAMDYSIIDAANEIIKRAKEDKITLNLTKLQKLMYFVYGEYLAQEKIRLFKDDEPRKLPYGPVFVDLYDITKRKGLIEIINPIALEEISDSDEIIEIVSKEDVRNWKENLTSTIDVVWNEHKNKTAKELSDDTHKEGYAWDKCTSYYTVLEDEDIVAEFEDREKKKH
jgi:uncharacterized phage-associated protein